MIRGRASAKTRRERSRSILSAYLSLGLDERRYSEEEKNLQQL